MAPGGGRGGFPETRASAVAAARSPDPVERARALDRIAEAYWRPLYLYLRLRRGRSPEDAQDLTQELFGRLVAGDLLAGFDPARARLRTFLRVCLDRLAMNEARDRGRLKRGGGAVHVPLDAELAPGAAGGIGASPPEAPDAFIAREFARSLLGLAVAELRARAAALGKDEHFALFERLDLDAAGGPRPSYAELAREHGLSSSDVTNRLAWARREFRRIALDRLRDMTASEAEFRREARSLLGIDP